MMKLIEHGNLERVAKLHSWTDAAGSEFWQTTPADYEIIKKASDLIDGFEWNDDVLSFEGKPIRPAGA